MGERRVLVIGSQWEKGQRLSFLPKLAQDLYNVLVDSRLGQCVPALGPEAGGSLVLDPTVIQAKDAIRVAFRRSSEAQATLLLAYIGHATTGSYDHEFFLLPADAGDPPDNDTALNLVELIRQLHGQHSQVDGLVVLIDACHAGLAAREAGEQWIAAVRGTLRFETLTATDDRSAYNGCFTRALVETIRTGLRDVIADHLRCEDFLSVVEQRCDQSPQLPSYRFGRDPALWLARNLYWSAQQEIWQRAGTAPEEISRRLAWYQPPAQLAAIVAQAQKARCLALVAHAGYGKSTTAAALARPEVAGGTVPAGFAQAVVFLNRAMGQTDLAHRLARQLRHSIDGFGGARQRFESLTPVIEWSALSTLQREVTGPLQQLPDKQVRIVLDGLDQASDETHHTVDALIEQVLLDEALQGVSFILTSWPDTVLPKGSQKIAVDAATDEQLLRYFQERGLPDSFRPDAAQRADKNWLIARLLADLHEQAPEVFTPQTLPAGLSEIYTESLLRAEAGTPDRWRNQLRPVLTVLAAAGVGPVLPFPLLVAASQALDGPSSPVRIRDVLVDLRGFVIRQNPGAPKELTGLFHQTLIDYLSDARHAFCVEPRDGHRALLGAISQLAPASKFDQQHLTLYQRYAAYREAEHLFGVERFTEIVESLRARILVIPTENLSRWRAWGERIEQALGKDHPDTLMACENIAYWVGEAGDAAAAVRLFRQLLPDRERVLGKDHPDTLHTRCLIAHWTGEAGDAVAALRLYRELLPDRERALGNDHPDTLHTRNDIAHWTGRAGDAASAQRLYGELLPDYVRVLGKDHRDAFHTRNCVAYWAGEAGDVVTALRLYRELLPDREGALGKDHPDTLHTRNDIAHWTGRAGDAAAALRLYRELLPDQQEILGEDHSGTLRTRCNIAHWAGEAGDAAAAVWLFRQLLPDRERVLGKDHPDTLHTRNDIAHWTGWAGDPAEALQLLLDLLPDQERGLGKDHPNTLRTRGSIAYWTGRTGDAVTALRLYRVLLPDRERALGKDHPDTLHTRGNVAHLTGRAGDPAAALQLLMDLLPDHVRVLGKAHRDTLRTVGSIIHWAPHVEDKVTALRLLRDLFPDQVQELDAGHPDMQAVPAAIARLAVTWES